MVAGIVTIVSLLAFLGGVAWAYSGKRRREFDEAARMPLDDDSPAPRPGAGDTPHGDGE